MDYKEIVAHEGHELHIERYEGHAGDDDHRVRGVQISCIFCDDIIIDIEEGEALTH